MFMNPNAVNVHEVTKDYLSQLVERGDERGLYDDLKCVKF